MTEQQFCYWLQGFAELSGDCPPTPEQWKSIREHLALCFKKVTPRVGEMVMEKSDFQKAIEDLRKHGAKTYPPPYPSYPPQTWVGTVSAPALDPSKIIC